MLVRALLAAAALTALPMVTIAATVRHAPPATRQATPAQIRTAAKLQPKFHPIKLGPHIFYGQIVSISGNSLVVQTRKKRLVTVDATTVLADGTYSAPLFVGKLVTIDGTQAASGIFTANHISRMTNLNELPNDH